MNQESTLLISDFKNNNDLSTWHVVDDGVMGGLSQGSLILNNDGNAVYSGYVTTKNNGGFSSVQHNFNKKEVSKFRHVILKVKGDGKNYQFRIKSDASQPHYYIHSFKTSGNWETIKLPLDSFYPSFRGHTLDKPNYPGQVMERIALLIGNKREEDFSLEIAKIYLE